MGNYDIIRDSSKPIKMWARNVFVEELAINQLRNVARMPFIHKWIAAMPDVHFGMGATVGSVIPTSGAVIPAAVGVDIGCGMMAVPTSLHKRDLPKSLRDLRLAIEAGVPHGRTNNGRQGDKGAWQDIPANVANAWSKMEGLYRDLNTRHPEIDNNGRTNSIKHLGTLGGGNHFIEVCLDAKDKVWFMLHSGSRGVGNRIGMHFIKLAQRKCKQWFIDLPDKDLAYFPEGTDGFDDYLAGVRWAQNYAQVNRDLMMQGVILAVRGYPGIPEFTVDMANSVNCHHNYVVAEKHFGKKVLITRKGAIRAGKGDMGIIPGNMGARTFIVRGLGNKESFNSASHGAGRMMSRKEAKRRFTVADHEVATAGIECRKDADVLDETPRAYRDCRRKGGKEPKNLI